MSFTENIVNKKEFGNPKLLEQVIEHFNINQYSSNFEKVIL